MSDCFEEIHRLRLMFAGNKSAFACKIRKCCDSADELLCLCKENEQDQVLADFKEKMRDIKKHLNPF